ncbi:MAG: hypothetical protein IJX24_06800 [Oscillospiraceae bacterium]|nr:hypothetical protein [Oscillospiraceae bacterium]
MADKPNTHLSDKPTVQMKKRANRGVIIVMVTIVGLLIMQLFKLSVIENSFYQNKANDVHFGEISISANRGSIYDANGVILAQSATVYKVFMDPDLFKKELEDIGEAAEGETSPEAEALKNEVISFLAQKLELTDDKIRESMEKNSQYEVLKTKVEKSVADEITAFMDEKDMNSIQIEQDTKRYYPQDELAASVIGFTNGDGDGQYGIEAQYDEYLAGTDGKVISAKDAY